MLSAILKGARIPSPASLCVRRYAALLRISGHDDWRRDPPNGEMMEIVPVDDRLLIETRLSPRDIAFIHPGQRALVKITAYDYAIYGGLDGVVETISPDTIQDKVKPEIFYYRVFIRTHQDYLQNKSGRRFRLFRA